MNTVFRTRLFLNLWLFLAMGFALPAYAESNLECDAHGPLRILSATDDGLHQQAHGPENVIDNNLFAGSRWSSRSQGSPKSLVLNLGAVQTLKSLKISWHKGHERKSTFSLAVSSDGSLYEEALAIGQSSGNSLGFETYQFEPVQARYVKIMAYGNMNNNWNSIIEVALLGCGKPVLGVLDLRLDASPAENFDLSNWYLTTPADDDGDGKADSIYENELAEGWTDPRYFFTDSETGGMVFRSIPNGAKTSLNTGYSRSELRGMLRKGDYRIPMKVGTGYPNKNNWVFSSAPVSAQALAGGVNGKLTATLAVNQVSRLGKSYQVGRVVIGQIHAKDVEPLRLYYRKLPNHKRGSIYYAHEPVVGVEQWVDIISERTNLNIDPVDGIALNERFTYEIEVTGEAKGNTVRPMLHVKIIRDDGTEVISKPLDMSDSGFSVENEYMYFKLGAYTQNNTSPDSNSDFDQVTFFDIETSHDLPPQAPIDGKKLTESAAKSDVKTALSSNVSPVNATIAGIDGPVTSQLLFDDHFSDGLRSNGPDELDSSWWTTSNSEAIEEGLGYIGLVTGSNGRGFRTTFDPVNLDIGQTVKSTFTFKTPQTVGVNRASSFRVGLYNKLGREWLEFDLAASSKQPNPLYDGLPGYMLTFDVNVEENNIASIRAWRHKDDMQGRLIGTSKGYDLLGGGGAQYEILPNSTYTGTIAINRVAEGVQVSGSLSHGGQILSVFSVIDTDSDVNDIGMLAFHANGGAFGSSKKVGEADNGLDFHHIKLELLSGISYQNLLMMKLSGNQLLLQVLGIGVFLMLIVFRRQSRKRTQNLRH